MYGHEAHKILSKDKKETAKLLQAAGIKGIRYIDQGSRGAGEGTHIALYQFNAPEYMECLFACAKLRAVPVNVNFRYTGAALTSDLAWIIGAAFAPLVALGLSAKFGLWAVSAYLLSGAIVTLVALRTNPQAKKQLGISTFLVDTKLPGIEVRRISTLGQHAIGTTEVTFTNVRVPRSALLGEIDKGWSICEDTLRYERLCLSAARIGAARRAFEFALDYAKTRIQFGKPIGSFQVIQHKFADMRIMLKTTQALTYRLADMLDAGLDPVEETAIAKIQGTDGEFKCAHLAMEIMGGAGYTMAHDIQRLFRDTRVGSIGGGTNDIQRNTIAKQIGL